MGRGAGGAAGAGLGATGAAGLAPAATTTLTAGAVGRVDVEVGAAGRVDVKAGAAGRVDVEAGAAGLVDVETGAAALVAPGLAGAAGRGAAFTGAAAAGLRAGVAATFVSAVFSFFFSSRLIGDLVSGIAHSFPIHESASRIPATAVDQWIGAIFDLAISWGRSARPGLSTRGAHARGRTNGRGSSVHRFVPLCPWQLNNGSELPAVFGPVARAAGLSIAITEVTLVMQFYFVPPLRTGAAARSRRTRGDA